MPFTISHPVAVLPIWYLGQRKLDLPALIVGSTIPDISYFVLLRPVDNIGHSPWGVLVQGIPCSLAILLLFSTVMLKPLHSLSSIFERLLPEEYSLFGIRRFCIILASIVVGATTHIVWDSFTHEGAFFVDYFALDQTSLLGFKLHKLLQYGGGLFGLSALGLVVFFHIKLSPAHAEKSLSVMQKSAAWIIILAVTVLVFASALLVRPQSTYSVLVVQSAIGTMSGSYAGILVYSLLHQTGVFRVSA